MSRLYMLFLTVPLILILSGCITVYQPGPGEQMVKVKNVGLGSPRICKAGQLYLAPAADDEQQAFRVPAGQRLTLGSSLQVQGYQVSYHCNPYLSFVPEQNAQYMLNSGMSGDGRCFVELVRVSPDTKTGLILEPSVAGPSCFKR